MKSQNSYCEICEKEVATEVREITEEFEVKDEIIKATIQIRVCKECGEEVYDEEIEKNNERIVFSAYRAKKGLLTPEEIKAIRKKYNLSQSDFSRLLGFGEKTITRYERGSIQDFAHDLLIRLMDDEKNLKIAYESHKNLFNEKERERFEKILYKGTIMVFSLPKETFNNKYVGNLCMA